VFGLPALAGQTLLHHTRAMMGQVERMRGELSEYETARPDEPYHSVKRLDTVGEVAC